MSAPRNYRRRGIALVSLAASLALTVAHASAQAPNARAGTAVLYESYSYGSPGVTGASSISLVTVPFAARVAVTRALALEAVGAYARARVTTFGTDFTMSGLTDTQVRATASLQRARTALALSGMALVPSGHARLGPAEAFVAGAVASDLLPFRISNWGAGGGAGVDASAVQGFEGGSVGVTAGYRLATAFQPFHLVDLNYRPGDELRVGAGLERTLAGERTVILQLSYARFGEDQWGDVRVFRTGARVLGLGAYTAPLGRGTFSGYGGALYRSGGALADQLGWIDLLSGIDLPPSETLLLLGSSARLPWRTRVLVPALDFRILRRGDGTGQGMLAGIGGAAELPLGDGSSAGVRLVPSARLRLGKLLVSKGAESTVSGFEFGLGLEFGGAR